MGKNLANKPTRHKALSLMRANTLSDAGTIHGVKGTIKGAIKGAEGTIRCKRYRRNKKKLGIFYPRT